MNILIIIALVAIIGLYIVIGLGISLMLDAPKHRSEKTTIINRILTILLWLPMLLISFKKEKK